MVRRSVSHRHRVRQPGSVLILIFFLIIISHRQAIKITIRIKIKALPEAGQSEQKNLRPFSRSRVSIGI